MQIKPSTILILLFILCIIGYASFNTSALRRGPVIIVETPTPYSTVPGAIEVRGRIKHVKTATINQKQMTFTVRGEFNESLVLTPPFDTVDIEAVSAYGKKTVLSIPLSVSN